MLKFLKSILGLGPKVNYKELMLKGAQIIDVRTSGEFKAGHIQGSVNIPLQILSSNLSKIKKDRPVITCCASGNRSGMAKTILLKSGFAEVYNGGGWSSLNHKL